MKWYRVVFDLTVPMFFKQQFSLVSWAAWSEEQDPTTDVQGDANAESARGRQYRETQGTGRRIVVAIESIYGEKNTTVGWYYNDQ